MIARIETNHYVAAGGETLTGLVAGATIVIHQVCRTGPKNRGSQNYTFTLCHILPHQRFQPNSSFHAIGVRGHDRP